MKNSLSAIIIGLSVIVTALVLSNAVKTRNSYHDSIRVTGLGKQDFTSDLIVWSANFSRLNQNLEEAYNYLNRDREIIKKYFMDEGVAQDELIFSSVDINKEYDYEYMPDGSRKRTFLGYRLNQSIKIESKEVDKVENLSREVTELIKQGVELYSSRPQFYYTGLSDLKIEMIAAATEDARVRAEQIADKSKAKLGNLKNANMGVFQIIAQNSNEDYSWGGTYNTYAKKKTATITMRLEFEIN